MTERIISIDPGFSGAVALFEDGKLKRIEDMPTMKVQFVKNGRAKTRSELDFKKLSNIFNDFKPNVTVIEHVTARPGQGVTSMFRFGTSYGALVACGFMVSEKVIPVRPNEWKTHFRISHEKEESLELAKFRFPHMAEMFRRKKDDGRAEAALIGLWYIESRTSKHHAP